jgi:hypothetical protein
MTGDELILIVSNRSYDSKGEYTKSVVREILMMRFQTRLPNLDDTDLTGRVFRGWPRKLIGFVRTALVGGDLELNTVMQCRMVNVSLMDIIDALKMNQRR